MSKTIQCIFVVSVIIFSSLIGSVCFVTYHKCIDFSVLEQYQAGRPSILLDDQGQEWGRFQIDQREPIALEQIPKHLIQAFLAAEDHSFFEHVGISWRGIVRSFFVNLYHGRKVQGASTITQQLVRLLFFDAKKTYTRKCKEQVYALLVEQQFSKEQILELYLNHVFFGCGIYGVEAAAQRFWGKHAWEVTLDEAAVLAAIMRSPNRYCPLMYPLSAQKRRNVVLGCMYKLHFINESELKAAQAKPVRVQSQDNDQSAPHLKEMIRIFMEETFGKTRLYTGGLRIQTTLNRTLQKIAQKEFNEQFLKLRQGALGNVDGALITIAVKTGEIKALIGGVDFTTSKFNRATQARRQVGSTFKPCVYTVAIDNGMSFADTDVDEQLELLQPNGKVWAPHNFDEEFRGRITLAYALSCSNNIVAIKTFLAVGAAKVIALAQRCRLRGPFLPYPSLALGCIDATLKDVVGMFNVFANNGVFVEPYCITWVKDQWGTKIWKWSCQSERVISSPTASQVTKVLRLSLERLYRVRPQPWVDGEIIGKTGTTNDSRTCWFTGSTPELTTAIYVGRDDNSSMGKGVFPTKTVFPIWIGLHRQVPLHQKKFVYDPSLQEVTINYKTGRKAFNDDPEAITLLVK